MCVLCGSNNPVDWNADVPSPQEVAQMVLDQVTNYPETHEQGNWEHTNCQTTRCIAGWAQYLVRGFVNAGDNSRGDRPSVALDAAKLLGFRAISEDWGRLFYDMNNDRVVRALRYLAEGKRIDWIACGYSRRYGE